MSAELKPGAVLDDRFTLIRSLGSGSTGAVWLAEDVDGSVVACKILHPQMSHDEAVVSQMMREAKVLTQLSHPNITRPIDFSAQGHFVYLAMEFVDGKPLHELLGDRTRHRRHLTGWQIRQLFGPLCDGVAYAHSKYIVHRDLKPQNVMVIEGSSGPQIKVLDFGLARLLEGSIFEVTTFGRAVGSLFYMSPEQTKGEPATVQSDVFALGSILFELITLHRTWARDTAGHPTPAFAEAVPGTTNNLAAVFDRIANGPRPHLRTIRPEVPAKLDELLISALAIEPKDRPSDVWELCREAILGLEELGDNTAPFVPVSQALEAPVAAEAPTGADPVNGPTIIVPPDEPSLTRPDLTNTEDSMDEKTAAATVEYVAATSDPADFEFLTVTDPPDQPNEVSNPLVETPPYDATNAFDDPTVDVNAALPHEALSATVPPTGGGADRGRFITTTESAAATEPGQLFEESLYPPVRVEPNTTPDDGPPVVVGLRPMITENRMGRGAAVNERLLARRAVVERRSPDLERGTPRIAMVAATEPPQVASDSDRANLRPWIGVGSNTADEALSLRDWLQSSWWEMPASSMREGEAPAHLLSQTWLWVVAAIAAASVGGVIGFSVFQPRIPTRVGVVHTIKKTSQQAPKRDWTLLKRSLQKMEESPEDTAVRERVKDLILGEAAAMAAGAKRAEIVRMASVSAKMGSTAGLKSAAMLLMKTAEAGR